MYFLLLSYVFPSVSNRRFYMYFLLFQIEDFICASFYSDYYTFIEHPIITRPPLLVRPELFPASQLLFLVAGLKYSSKVARNAQWVRYWMPKLKTVDENLQLGLKKSTILGLLLWNLVIITYRWGSTIDKVSLQPGVIAAGQELWIFYWWSFSGPVTNFHQHFLYS